MAEKTLLFEKQSQRIHNLEKEVIGHEYVQESSLHEKIIYESILDSLPGIFYLFDEKGNFLLWNKNFEEITEYSSEEISIMKPVDFFVEEDKAEVADKIGETFIKGSSFVEAIFKSKSDNRFYFYLTGRRLIINDKYCLAGVGIDISERKKAENIIRDNEHFLDIILNSIQDGISVLDSDLNIIRANKTMQTWYAHMLPLEGKKCYEAYHLRKKACETCPTVRALHSGKLEMNEVPLNQDERSSGILELFAFPMLDKSGKTKGVVEYVRNITERKRAEESLQEAELVYRTIADFNYDWEYWITNENEIRYMSPSVERISGYRPEEFINNPALLEEIIFHEDRKIWDLHRQDTLKEQKLQKIQFRIIRRDGEICWIEHACMPVSDPVKGSLGFRASNRDITDNKRTEEAIEKYAAKIKMFAYSISHDLKNPLIGINLLAKALFENYNEVLDEKGKQYCDFIVKGSEDLAILIDRINIYISTKEVPLNIEYVNLNKIFDIVKDGFSPQLLTRRISWSQPENTLYVNVDRLSILRVIRILVDNALKYGGDILSEIKIEYEESDLFHIISVKDDGVGIENKFSEKIFGLFSRVTTVSDIQGSGLGLAIANGIAKKHKGSAWVEPGSGKGVTFFISISKNLKLTKL